MHLNISGSNCKDIQVQVVVIFGTYIYIYIYIGHPKANNFMGNLTACFITCMYTL